MTRKRRVLPKEPVTARTEALTHDGRGIARVDGTTVFIDGALAPETVQFKYSVLHRDYAEGQVDAVLEPAASRVEPSCEHYSRCGGCSLQHMDPAAQLAAKQAQLLEQLRRIAKVTEFDVLPPVTGPVWGYRGKARLGVRFVAAKGRCVIGFNERQTHWVADLQHCHVLHPKLGPRLQELAMGLSQLSIRESIPQVEVAVGDDELALVVRVMRSPTDQDIAQLQGLGADLQATVYLQPNGPPRLVSLDGKPVQALTYALPAHAVSIAFLPTEFTQINQAVNRELVDRVVALLAPEPTDRVLDLFCGVGNFTLPLARRVHAVTGVEVLPHLVERATENARTNCIENAQFFSADLSAELGGAAWAVGGYSKAILDPARGGAREVLPWLPRWGIRRAVYVSCNPATLARDVGSLVHEFGYRLLAAGVVDMFPHTAHVESIALLQAVP